MWNDGLDLKTDIKRWWELSHGKKATLGSQASEPWWLNPWGKMDSSMKAAVCSQTPIIPRMSQRHKWHCCCLTRYWQRSQWNSSKPYNSFPDLEFVVLTISSWTPPPGSTTVQPGLVLSILGKLCLGQGQRRTVFNTGSASATVRDQEREAGEAVQRRARDKERA